MPDTEVTTLEKPTTLGEARKRAAGVPMQHVGAGTFLPDFSDMQQVMEFASLMAGAGVMVGHAVRGNPGACMAVTMISARFNLDPFMLSSKAYITKNKAGVEVLAWEAQAINAMIMGAGVLEEDLDYEFLGEGVDRQVRVFGKLKGAEKGREILSNRIKDIKVKNSPLWTSEPDQQLSYYGSRLWVRRHAPAVLMGIYAPDEMSESTMRNITPIQDVEDPAQRLQARLDQAKPQDAQEEPEAETDPATDETQPAAQETAPAAEKQLDADASDQDQAEDDPQADLLTGDEAQPDVVDQEAPVDETQTSEGEGWGGELPNLPEIREPAQAHDNALKLWAEGALQHVQKLPGTQLGMFWADSKGIVDELKERLPKSFKPLDAAFDARLEE